MCASSCPEGALQVIDGKARLVGDLLCDGLGACLSSCPEDAIKIENREAEPYNELVVIKNIIRQGPNVLLAHLEHLKSHRQLTYLDQALSYLRENKIPVDLPSEFAEQQVQAAAPRQCPGSMNRSFAVSPEPLDNQKTPSQLSHWPVQLHLLSPQAPQYRDSDLLVAADCVPFAFADFHRDYLKGRTLAIACPKLDSRQEVYTEKLVAMIDQAEVRSIRIMIMQVPCCSGLLRHVVDAAGRAKRKVPISCVIVGISGEILSDTPIDINQ